MDLSLKEGLGLLVGLVVCAIIFFALLNFGFFNTIGEIIEGVV